MRAPMWPGRSGSLAVATALIVLMFSIGSALAAGLTDSDIAILERQATDEGWTFTVEKNPATEYTLDELCGLVEPPDWREKATFDPISQKSELPASFDWRDVGGTASVKNQGGCGSCWAFATVGALECAIKIRDGVEVDLSEQYLLSCNSRGWDCGGGWFAHSYHMTYSDYCGGAGAVLEADFPYVASRVACACPFEHPYTIEGWTYIGPQYGMASVHEMKQAIVDYGPIAVCVTANGAMQAYGGGIFNACTDEEINHAVVLVGWDDNQGAGGVWFMRNSWGSWWGEGGYMRIEYGCSSIGYGANYINYRPINVSCVNGFGESPLSVDFEVNCSWSDVTACTWDLGDGQQAYDQAVSHLYANPGSYDVSVLIQTTEGTFEKSLPGAVAAYADTVYLESQSYDSTQIIEIPVIVKNNLALREIVVPFTWEGPLELTLDSFSTAGHRAAAFEFQSALNYDASHSRATICLMPSLGGGGQALQPGEGSIMSLFFTPSPSALGSNPVEFTEYAIYRPNFVSSAGEYLPGLIGGAVSIGTAHNCCSGRVGDANSSGEDVPSVGDIASIVDHLFVSGQPLACYLEADANQSGGANPESQDITVADIGVLVDHLFISGQPLPECF